MPKLPALSLHVADKVVKASGSLHSPGPHLSFKGTVTSGDKERGRGGEGGLSATLSLGGRTEHSHCHQGQGCSQAEPAGQAAGVQRDTWGPSLFCPPVLDGSIVQLLSII